MYIRNDRWALMVAVVGFFAANLSADTIYTNQAAWDAAVPGETTTNYTGIVGPSGVLVYGTGPGATTTLHSVTYTLASSNSDAVIEVVGQNVLGLGVPAFVAGASASPGPNTLSIAPPNPVYALGFNYDGDAGGTLKVTLSDGTIDTINAIYPTVDFFGVTSTNPITSVELSTPSNSGSGQGIFLTQFAYGPAAATGVPEPKSILLTLTMAVFLLLARQVRIRAKQC